MLKVGVWLLPCRWRIFQLATRNVRQFLQATDQSRFEARPSKDDLLDKPGIKLAKPMHDVVLRDCLKTTLVVGQYLHSKYVFGRPAGFGGASGYREKPISARPLYRHQAACKLLASLTTSLRTRCRANTDEFRAQILHGTPDDHHRAIAATAALAQPRPGPGLAEGFTIGVEFGSSLSLTLLLGRRGVSLSPYRLMLL